MDVLKVFSATVLPIPITLFIAVVISKIVLWYTRMRRIYKLAAQYESPPECPAHPLLGHVKYRQDGEGFLQLARSAMFHQRNFAIFSSEDVNLGNYIFPKDSELKINILNVHYFEKYFKNPKTFKPERFMASRSEAQVRHRYAYLPFQIGKRNCLGERFAYLSLISSMVAILQKFSIKTSYDKLENNHLTQEFTPTALDGFNVRLLPRK